MKYHQITQEQLTERNKQALQETLDAYANYRSGKINAEQFWNFMSETGKVIGFKVEMRIREIMVYDTAKEDMHSNIEGKAFILKKDEAMFSLMLRDAKANKDVQDLLFAIKYPKLIFLTIANMTNLLNAKLKNSQTPPSAFERKMINNIINSDHFADILKEKYDNRKEEKKWATELKETGEKYPIIPEENKIDTFLKNFTESPITNQPSNLINEQNKAIADNFNLRLILLLVGVLLGITISYFASKLLISTRPIPMVLYPLHNALPENSIKVAESIIMSQINDYNHGIMR